MSKIIVPGGEVPNVELDPTKDPFAITHEPAPPRDTAKIMPWVNGKPSGWNKGVPLEIDLALDKLHYQRGLLRFRIGDRETTVSMDALLSVIYSFYDVKNPYRRASDADDSIDLVSE
jgi:hypothetical protein